MMNEINSIVASTMSSVQKLDVFRRATPKLIVRRKEGRPWRYRYRIEHLGRMTVHPKGYTTESLFTGKKHKHPPCSSIAHLSIDLSNRESRNKHWRYLREDTEKQIAEIDEKMIELSLLKQKVFSEAFNKSNKISKKDILDMDEAKQKVRD